MLRLVDRGLALKTLDHLDPKGKVVILRVDVNSPINPETGEILDDERFRSHLPTIRELLEKRAKVVIMAHQSRPGARDFTTTKKHAVLFSKLLGFEIEYIEDIFGKYARESIVSLDEGDAIMLENVRFYSEETLKRSPEEHSRCVMVRKLSRVSDVYVNDAFAAAHRPHASIIGFPPVIPSYAGRLMEKEYHSLVERLRDPGRPSIFVLGGAKLEDALNTIENSLERGIADKVLLTGLVANLFLLAKGVNLGKENEELIKKKDNTLIEKARSILSRFKEKIVLPEDFGVEIGGERIDISIKEVPPKGRILDIGIGTAEKYSEEIMSSKTIVANGPAGMFEVPQFAIGTEMILRAMARTEGFTVIGGGHLVAAVKMLGLEKRINHVSTGGGASTTLLSGVPLPGIEVLNKYEPR
ncbi:phosphoglycerate kinase [Thermococci archaeon]|nr:MAG: phosphoglycerate kinase [Thermococci archaeon]RLF95873.1 MAG: phosphoglycerate kinase [Thermococci archaeon]